MHSSVGDAVSQGLLGYRREHAGLHLRSEERLGPSASSRHEAAITRRSLVSRWPPSFATDRQVPRAHCASRSLEDRHRSLQFAKRWSQWELNGLVSRLMAGERNVIVPIWHEVNVEAVRAYSPALADLVAARSSEGVVAISDKIERVLRHLEDGVQQDGRTPRPDPSTREQSTTRTASPTPVAVPEVR